MENYLIPKVWKDPHKRRGYIEIMAEILKSAKGGVQKTQIMHQASLSFFQLTQYLPLLVKSGLLQVIKKDKKVIYKTSPKGLRFIKYCEEIKRLIKEKQNKSKFQVFAGLSGKT